MGRCVFLGVGIFLLSAGIFFTGLLGQLGKVALEMRGWPQVRGVIRECELEITDDTITKEIRYQARVAYDFAWDGQLQRGSRIKRVDSASAREASARRWIEKFPMGESVICYVNTESMGDTVLIPETLAPLYTLWFPFAFVVFGGGLVWRGIRWQV